MAKKRVRRNYYKNSRAQRRQRIVLRCFVGLRMVFLMAGMVGASLLLILAYDAVTQSAYFEARTIGVEGNGRLSRATILEQSGLKLNQNILSVNLETLRSKLMVHPWIAAAEIKRELPDTINIRVKERVPVAVVDLNRPYYLDEEGEIFKAVEPSDDVNVPLVTGLSFSDLDLEDPWRSRLVRALMEALRFSRAHQQLTPCQHLRRIHVDREMGLTLYTLFPTYTLAERNDYTPASGTPEYEPSPESGAVDEIQVGQGMVTIKVGFEDYESKLKRLAYMLSYLEQEHGLFNFQFIDLNDMDRVVVKSLQVGPAGTNSAAEDCRAWLKVRKEV